MSAPSHHLKTRRRYYDTKTSNRIGSVAAAVFLMLTWRFFTLPPRSATSAASSGLSQSACKSFLTSTKVFNTSGPPPEQLFTSFPHVFLLPDKYKSLFCTPQKNGNNYWGLLIDRMHHACSDYSCVQSADDFNPDFELDQQRRFMTASVLKIVNSMDNFFMIARDPYSRLLSAYIEKFEVHDTLGWKDVFGGQRIGDPLEMVPHETLKAANVPVEGKPQSFREFVEALYRLYKLDPALMGRFNVHWRRQVHHCLLPYGVGVTILRLEDEYSWFPCFVEKFGLHDIVNNGWGDEKCFLKYDGSCDVSTWPSKLKSGNNFRFADPLHGNGASSKLLKYYDTRIAAMVTEMYAQDLEFFGYAKWNGSS